MRIIAFLVALVAALTIGGASPASAEVVTFTDDAYDVLSQTTGETAARQSGIDIRRVTVDLNADRLAIKSTHLDLTNGNAWDTSYFYIYPTAESARSGIPAYVVTNNGMEYTFQRTKTWWQVNHPSPSREVNCASRMRIRPDLDTISLRIPRGCIGNPWRVRFVEVVVDFRTADLDVFDVAGSHGRWVTKG